MLEHVVMWMQYPGYVLETHESQLNPHRRVALRSFSALRYLEPVINAIQATGLIQSSDNFRPCLGRRAGEIG